MQKNMMQTFLGLLLVIVGVILGIWLGLFVMFVGGAVQIINNFVDFPNHFSALSFVWGMVKFWLSGLVGWLTFIFCSTIGSLLLKDV